jgi:hypothetical protein
MATVAKRAAGDWRFFDRLDDPDKSFTVRLYDRVMVFFSTNWPAGVDWPGDIDRPPRNAAAAIDPPKRGAAVK